MMKKIKALYRLITGEWMGEVIDEVKCSTTSVCEKVDDLLTRAQVDGEDYWFLQDRRKRPSGAQKHNGPLTL